MVNLLEEYLSQIHSTCGLPLSFNFIVTQEGLNHVKPERVDSLKDSVFTAKFISPEKILISWDNGGQTIYPYYNVQKLIRQGHWEII